MKKILLIDGTYPINTRNKRMVDTLKKIHIVRVCAWNRENINFEEKDDYIYSSNEGYGNKIKKLYGMRNYFNYIKKVIVNYNPEIIISSQWDMLLLTILSNFKGKIIYENLDLPTSTNSLVLNILLMVEKLMLKKVSGIIYASRFFIPLYNKYKGAKLLLENLPLKEVNNKSYKIEKREKLRISFIGGLRYFETMKNLLLAIQEIENIEVYLIGKGAENNKFQNFIESNELKNIYMIGKYEYKEIKKLYLNTDFVWAVYPNKDYNVKFAISNKFYESVLFEKPCFFSKNTLLGDLVKKNKIGIIVDPYNIEEIKSKIRDLDTGKILMLKENIKIYKRNKKLYWEDNEKELLNFINNI
ncbi:glycosyltransferase [Fusobacterium sp. SYSU M8D902]|uniref:glycosyltransferase n=1 Tax=Fusobacterium sp. SYSU M8D902 TaxID=3159562 RepID=UPI0032E3DF84